jgi:hypothetical protein
MKISDTLARELVPHVKAAIEAIRQGFKENLRTEIENIFAVLGPNAFSGLADALYEAAADIDPISADTAVTPTFVQQLFAPLKPPLTDAEIEAQDAEWRRERRQEREDCRGTGMQRTGD